MKKIMNTLSKFLFLFIISTTLLSAEQKVVLISGATGGIGKATVEAFASKGWKVWAGTHATESDTTASANVTSIALDVTNDDEVNQAVQTVLATDHRIDALINMAGYGLLAAEECATLAQMQKQFDVNFFGVMRLVQAVVPAMRQAKAGHIINISSTSGVRAVGGLGLYAASKFALEGVSESLAVTLSPWNIKVSLVEPGTVANEWVQNCAKGLRDVGEPLYAIHQEALQKKLAALASTGQACDEIATLIVSIAENEKPNMRYQTSSKVLDTVSQKLVDPTGNRMLESQIAFFNTLIAK